MARKSLATRKSKTARNPVSLSPASLALSLCILGVGSAAPAQAQDYSLTGLGFLNNSNPYSLGWAVSGDGSTVVGYSVNAAGRGEAFRWTAGSGIQGLGFLNLSNPSSWASGISDDGSTVVGYSNNATNRTEAFRWTAGSGMQGLGFLTAQPTFSVAEGVSGNGSTVVGYGTNTVNRTEAFRWTAGSGMQGLGFLSAQPTYSQAHGVSGDGRTVVGVSTNATNQSEAFRWTSGSGMQGLGFLGGTYSRARGVSGDGSTVVGESTNTVNRTEAFRWTAGSGMQGLGFLTASSTNSRAFGVSGDGSVIVGDADIGIGGFMYRMNTEAFRWTEATGMQSLADLLAAEGVNMTGVTLRTARDVSDDGTIITGEMRNASGQGEAYLALYDTGSDTPVAGVIAPASFAESVNGIADLSRGVRAEGEAGLRQISRVARHYALPEITEVTTARGFGGVPDIQFGAFGYGEGLWGDDSPAGQATTKKGTLGLIGQTRTGLRVGLGLQKAGLDRTDGYLGSSVEADGSGGVAFVAYQPADTGWRLIGSATFLRLDADIDRNYMNGAAEETASGSTDGTHSAVELEAAYTFKMKDSYSLSPFASYQYSKAEFDGYDESGATFDGEMSDQESSSRTFQVGVESAYQFSSALELIGSVSVGRTSEDLTAPGLAVTNLNGMQFSGASGDRDYSVGTLSLGANYQLSPTTTLYGNIEGQNAFDSEASDIDAVSASIGFTVAF